MSGPEEEMFSPAASLPAFDCLPQCCSCLKARLGKKLSRKAVRRERDELQEQGGEHEAGSAGDLAGDRGKKGGAAGLLPGHVWGGCWLHPWLRWCCWGGRMVLGQKQGSELASPWPQGCVSGEFARAGRAGIVLTLLQVPSQYLLQRTGSTGRRWLIQPKTCQYELNLQK